MGLVMDQTRCTWRGMAGDPLYEHYHDTEWGVPERDSRALWEKLVLDGFQAGLAWITILRKRDAFRAAFDGFDPEKVARYGEADRARLLADAGIIRSNAVAGEGLRRRPCLRRRRGGSGPVGRAGERGGGDPAGQSAQGPQGARRFQEALGQDPRSAGAGDQGQGGRLGRRFRLGRGDR